ncbi:MAG: permease [Mangrovicoccus sp.]|nr:permease [Mangrovicoccus sp.]
MTHTYPEQEDVSEDRMFKEANAMFHRAVCALGDLVQRIEAGEMELDAEAKQVIRALDNSSGLVLKERQRFDDRKSKQIGAAAGGCVALDFDAARVEIGRRLARLRAAEGAGGVSG